MTDSPASEKLSQLREIQRRSQQSAAKLSQKGSVHGMWTAIGFRIANNNFLVPLEETREVFTLPSQINSVPKSKSWVYGIANLRGELLPIFDLKSFLYDQDTQINKQSRIVVNNHSELFLGLLVDEIFGLKHFPNQPDNTIHNATDSQVYPYIIGSISQQNTDWNIFSFNKLTLDNRFLDAAA